MGQALYRKYRSKTLSDIVGQDHITKTLDQAIKTKRISHAYLFTGPRGVGKTSIARILAHDINGIKYVEGSTPVDIIEIDAASHRRIDEIRELREKVYVSPVSAKYKVYIIDEVHMLTKQSFNALLKTLEEPPEHVVFILATTDSHKLPDTIISRTQRFQFKPIDTAKISDHLRYIANQENIKIDDQALAIIAEHGQGTFRDSISLLDQAANLVQPITASSVNALLGIPPDNLINSIISLTASGDSNGLIKQLNLLIEQGYPAATIASKLSSVLRSQVIEGKEYIERDKLLNLLARLIDVPASANPERYLEICLLKALPKDSQNPITKPEPAPPIENEIKSAHINSKTKPVKEAVKTNKTDHKTTNGAQPTNQNLDNKSWQEVLDILKSKYNTLYGIVRMAAIDSSNPDVLKLQFAYPFHQKRINDAKNRDIILETVKQVTGRDMSLECIVDKELLNRSKTKAKEEPNLKAISSIFGISQ